MPYDQCVGKALLQFGHQCSQGFSLPRCTRVARLSLRIQSPFVADAYRVAVMSPAMGAHLLRWPARMHRAIPREVIVVADVPEVPVPDVVPAASLEVQAPPFGSGGAVDNNQGDGPHVSRRMR